MKDTADKVIEVSDEHFSRNDERALPTVQGPQPTSLMQAITMAASNPAMDMDKIERLFAMHQKVLAQEAEAAFNDAMARAQKNMIPVIANQRNELTHSTYADLAAISTAITPIYSVEGLSVSYDSNRPILHADGKPIDPPPQGWFRTIGIVAHSAGHSRMHHIDLPSDDVGLKGNASKTPIQGVVSMITYGRRCLTCMIFNVAISDADGNPPTRPEAKEPARPDPQPYPAESFSENFPKWAKLIESGKKTGAQIIAMVGSKAILSDQQKADINAIEGPKVDPDFVADMERAK